MKTLRAKEDWIAAAIAALAREGESGLAVEPLAAALDVTKGSFYWHFRNREALLVAVLEVYEARGADQIIAMLSAVENPKDRLSQLFEMAFGNPEALRAERTLAAMQNEKVQRVMTRVNRKRRAFLERLFTDLKLSPANAKYRAAAAYAAYLGAMAMADEAPWKDANTRGAWVKHLLALLLNATRASSGAG